MENVKWYKKVTLQYGDEQVNKILKNCVEDMVKDDEWDYRGLIDFNILLEQLDLFFDWDKESELKLYTNIWWICGVALDNILALYNYKIETREDIELIEYERVVDK